MPIEGTSAFGCPHSSSARHDAQLPSGTLTIIMIGHPKLGNDLNKPTMEEIGALAKLFSLDSWGLQKERYIEWALTHCNKPKTTIHDILTPDAVNHLTERLITPLQICHYLTLALIKGATTETKPVDTEIVEAVLPRT